MDFINLSKINALQANLTNQVVADITARNAIPTENRRIGMEVKVLSNNTKYELLGGIEDTNWSEVVSDGTNEEEVNALISTAISGKANTSEVTAALANKANKSEVTNVMTPKGISVYASLPTTGNTIGDYFYCSDGDGTHGAGNYAWSGTAWYFSGTGDNGYNMLQTDMTYITKTQRIQMINKKYINTSSSPVSLTPVTDNAFRHAIIPCVAGDTFTINAKGGTNPRTWCFIDSSNNILSNANASTTDTDLIKVAPANSAYLIINDQSNGVSYAGVTVNKNISDINAVIKQFISDGWLYCGLIGTSSSPKVTSGKFNTLYIPTGRGMYTNFLDSDGNPIQIIDEEISLIRGVTSNYVVHHYVKESIAGFFGSKLLNTKYIGEANEANTILGKDQAGANAIGTDINGNTDIGCNVAVGYQNMRSNTGVKNIAVGNQNLMNNTGTANIAIGYHSGFRMTSGKCNVGVGNETNDDVLSGDNNTAIGTDSLQRNSLGSGNVAVGYRALQGNMAVVDPTCSHSYNIAAGCDAMRNHKSGDYNIGIGYQAGDTDGLTNTISIGKNASATASNQMVLGSSTITSVIIAGKKINFNSNGTVTWEAV